MKRVAFHMGREIDPAENLRPAVDLQPILDAASSASSDTATDQQRASCAFLRAFPGIRRVLLLMGELRPAALSALADESPESLTQIIRHNTNHKTP